MSLWLDKAISLENDTTEIGALLFWDAVVQSLHQELDAWRHLHKQLTKGYPHA